MKATQYFAGFGPTLWSFRRGETEYGVKAIPAGGFVKIIGMTPLEELAPEDPSRAFWRYPAVAAHGRAGRGVGDALPHRDRRLLLRRGHDGPDQPCDRRRTTPTRPHPSSGRSATAWSRSTTWTRTAALRECKAGRPVRTGQGRGHPAGRPDHRRRRAARSRRTASWSRRSARRRPARRTFDYVRDGDARHRDGRPRGRPSARPSATPAASSPTVSAAGIAAAGAGVRPALHLGEAPAAAVWYVGQTVGQTFAAIAHFPERIPNLVHGHPGWSARRGHAGERRRRQPDRRASRSSCARGMASSSSCSAGSTSSSGSSTCCRCSRSTAGTSRSPGYERLQLLARGAPRPAGPGTGRLQQAPAADVLRRAALRRA